MRFAHEMNGNWYPWSASNGQSTPADYANMWRFVKTRLDNMGIDKKHMQWIFSGICIDVGGFKIEDYYPGDDYVDWIGLGGMNFGYSEANMGWNAPNFLFNR
jgi:mannan endo-1,4-beta-mannosidase